MEGREGTKLRGLKMKFQSIMLLIVCAVALSGCETINQTWHDIFGFNTSAPALNQQAQTR